MIEEMTEWAWIGMAPKKKGGKKGGKKGKGGGGKAAKVLAYHDEEYWNNRYTKNPEPFDWYQSYKELKPLLELYLPKDQIVFNAGCGNGSKSNVSFFLRFQQLLSTIFVQIRGNWTTQPSQLIS